MTDFTGKKVLVLGGSRGIGAAIVRRFAEDGAAVTFTYGGSKDAAEALARETKAKTVHSDSADRKGLVETIETHGPLDVLVINAGIFVGGEPLEAEADDIDRLIDINVRAPYHAAVQATRHMEDGSRIIIIGSNTGSRAPFPGMAAYAMTKSAMQGLARGLARDLGSRAITVNVVQPGPVDTDMNPADGPMKDMMHSFMAIKRHATGAEVAGMVAYLAGPEAAMVTGAMHTIDGGMAA